MPQPKGRDLQKTQGPLLRWLEGKLPNAEKLAIENLRGPSDTGFSSDTLMFDLAYEESGAAIRKPLVMRLKPISEFGVFPEYDVALQHNMMQALAATAVPVPTMLWLEEDGDALSSPFYVMEHLRGQVPNDNPPYHREGWLCDLTPQDREKLWMSGVDAMAEVHKLDATAPEFDFLPQPPAGKTGMEAQLDYWSHYLDWGLERPRYALLNECFDWLVSNVPSDEPLGICWGDSRISNQIFQDCKVAAVIDWEMVFLGNPVADLAWFITIDRVNSQGIGVERLAGMPGRDATVARWQARTGQSADHLNYYELFCAFRYGAILSRLFMQMKHYEVLPADATIDVENFSSPVLREILAQASR